jgi:transposase
MRAGSSMKQYPKELKESIARQYLAGDLSYRRVASGAGVSAWSVRDWVSSLRKTGSVGNMKRTKKSPTDDRSAEEKLRLLLKVAALSEDERGTFLRGEGLHDGDLERWQQEALSGLGAKGPDVKDPHALQRERKLAKTEARLREAEALLDLQKKVHALWGDEDDDTPSSSGV